MLDRTMRTSDFTLSLLHSLKPYAQEKHPDQEPTNDLIVRMLLSEHEQQFNPEIQQQKQEELLKDYVHDSQYNDLYKQWNELKETQKELTESLKIAQEKINRLDSTIRELEETNGKLQISLTNKENQISDLTTENKRLMDCLTDIQNNSLPKLKNEYDQLNRNHQNLVYQMENDYFPKQYLETLYRIACYLKKHKRNYFTLDQIATQLHLLPEILEDPLQLTKYKIFPIRKYKNKQDNTLIYCFDRKYLRW